MDMIAEDLPNNDPDILLHLVGVSCPLCIHNTLLIFLLYLLNIFMVGLIHEKFSHEMLLKRNQLSAAHC